MQIIRKKLIICPCCNMNFNLELPSYFTTLPLSEEQKHELEKEAEKNKKDGIETNYIFLGTSNEF